MEGVPRSLGLDSEVPYDGPVDKTFTVTAKKEKAKKEAKEAKEGKEGQDGPENPGGDAMQASGVQNLLF